MQFDKKSAKLAGKKSKRGPAKKDESSIYYTTIYVKYYNFKNINY